MSAVVVAAVVGVATGVASNAVYQWLKTLRAWLSDRIELGGTWGERVVGSGERLYSIGEIHYELKRAMWVFDGTNYHNDGQPFCHWRTISSFLDRHNKRFYYIFLNTHEDQVHAGYTGFGVVQLSKVDKRWIPTRGAFAAGNPGETFRSHSMIRIHESPSTIAGRIEAFQYIDNEGSEHNG